jgi:glutathione-regulated potassium-efflux system ancillary protein KefC
LLLQHALIYLIGAVVCVPLAKRLGLGSVLGYLLAGLAIGPAGLGLIAEGEETMHFAELGVVIMLFLVGLELAPQRLWEMRRPIFGLGGWQVLATTALLVALALAFHMDWQVAVIAAMGMSLSSTAIALQILAERNEQATPAGRLGFATLLFQDLAVIPMLALIPFLGQQAAAEGFDWPGAAKAAAVIVGIVVGGRFALLPLLRIVAATQQREIFTASALLIVIAIALLMNAVGMSMALGTFLAGVLLAESEYRHALEADLEPFKGLLLGLFFIAVGMSLDLALIQSHWRTLLAGGGVRVGEAGHPVGLGRVVRGAQGAALVFRDAAVARRRIRVRAEHHGPGAGHHPGGHRRPVGRRGGLVDDDHALAAEPAWPMGRAVFLRAAQARL